MVFHRATIDIQSYFNHNPLCIWPSEVLFRQQSNNSLNNDNALLAHNWRCLSEFSFIDIIGIRSTSARQIIIVFRTPTPTCTWAIPISWMVNVQHVWKLISSPYGNYLFIKNAPEKHLGFNQAVSILNKCTLYSVSIKKSLCGEKKGNPLFDSKFLKIKNRYKLISVHGSINGINMSFGTLCHSYFAMDALHSNQLYCQTCIRIVFSKLVVVCAAWWHLRKLSQTKVTINASALHICVQMTKLGRRQFWHSFTWNDCWAAIPCTQYEWPMYHMTQKKKTKYTFLFWDLAIESRFNLF